MTGGFLFGIGTLAVFSWAIGGRAREGADVVVALAFAALMLAFLCK